MTALCHIVNGAQLGDGNLAATAAAAAEIATRSKLAAAQQESVT
jgi:hypothetical protein